MEKGLEGAAERPCRDDSGGVFDPLEQGQRFRFACHPALICFTDCCRDLTLRLTPYDVIRARRALGLDSSEFLERHTVAETDPDWKVPGIRLRMEENARRTCPFVKPDGCTIYADRPGACRAYPLARAARSSPGLTAVAGVDEKYFLVREAHCAGFGAGREWTAGTWMQDQDLTPYNEMNDLWMGFLSRYRPGSRPGLTSKHWQMFYLACYSPDRFRAFVFNTRFLTLFEVSDETVKALRRSDEELLKFSLNWLAFSLFGDPVLRRRPGSVEDAGP